MKHHVLPNWGRTKENGNHAPLVVGEVRKGALGATPFKIRAASYLCSFERRSFRMLDPRTLPMCSPTLEMIDPSLSYTT